MPIMPQLAPTFLSGCRICKERSYLEFASRRPRWYSRWQDDQSDMEVAAIARLTPLIRATDMSTMQVSNLETLGEVAQPIVRARPRPSAPKNWYDRLEAFVSSLSVR